MSLFIPAHLQKLEIIQQLQTLLQKYGELQSSGDQVIDFDEFYYQQSLDPVKTYIRKCIVDYKYLDQQELTKAYNNKEEALESIINYITQCFYCCSGTQKVLDLMRSMLNVPFKGDPQLVYGGIQVEIDSIGVNDVDDYLNSFKDFLNHLLYFDDIKLVAKLMKLDIFGDLGSSYLISNTPYLKLTLDYEASDFEENTEQ